MRLSVSEFEAMQMPWRKWYIKNRELRNFKKFGLVIEGRDILEVGCGSGYAASLICAENPRSYTGIDIMEEQLEIARNRNLKNASFVCCDAADLSQFEDESFDAVLDFCILHHVEGWRTFFDECRRVLRKDGSIYVADLSRDAIHLTDALLHWGHAEEALFSFQEFEEEAARRGFPYTDKAEYFNFEAMYRFKKL